MRQIFSAILGIGLLASAAGAQEVGKAPKEIKAKGWINSAEQSIAKNKGKVVVVEFWATWCPPCRTSIPHLVELRNKLDKAKVEIIGLTDETADKVEPFAKEFKMNYTVGYGSMSGNDFGVTGIPHAFIIGPDGLVKWEGHPMAADFEKTLTQLAETVKVVAAGSPEPKKALGEALAAAAKDGAASDVKIAWTRTEAGKKAPREFILTGAEFELRTDKDERKKGKLEDKELADLVKVLADSGFATKESKPPAKATVTLAVSAGGDARELSFDPAKGYGTFAKALRSIEDLFAKYSAK